MKDDEIFVLDNIVSLATQNLIERLVRESVSWKFIPNVAYVDGYTLDQPLKETPGMSQIIYNNALGVNNKDLFPLVLLLIDEVSLKTKLLIQTIRNKLWKQVLWKQKELLISFWKTQRKKTLMFYNMMH